MTPSPRRLPGGWGHGWRSLFKVGAAVAVLGVVFWRVPLGEVVAAMGKAEAGAVLAAFLLGMASQATVSLRLRELLRERGIATSTGAVLRVNLSATFYGLFVPGGNLSKSAVRFYHLSGSGRRHGEVGAAILLDRLAATAALGGVGLVFWLAAAPGDTLAAGLGLAVVFLGAAIAPLPIFRALLPLVRGAARRVLGERGGRAERILEGLSRISTPRARTLGAAYALSGAAHLLRIGAWFVLASGAGLTIRYGELAWVVAAVGVLTLLPLSPGGLGIREGGAAVLLGAHGVAAEEAVALSLLAFGSSVVLVGLVGGCLEGWRILRPASPGSRARSGSADPPPEGAGSGRG